MINNQILNITFSSPNKKALNKACLLFARYFLNQKNSLLKKIKISAKKKTNKYTVTLLKSPHVHKTAQETFASEFYTKKITINCYLLKFCNLYFLKKSIESLFSNVSIKTQIYTYRQNELRLILQLIYPKNKKINKKLIVFYTWLKKNKKVIWLKKKHKFHIHKTKYPIIKPLKKNKKVIWLKKKHKFHTHKTKYPIKPIMNVLQLLCLTGELNKQVLNV